MYVRLPSSCRLPRKRQVCTNPFVSHPPSRTIATSSEPAHDGGATITNTTASNIDYGLDLGKTETEESQITRSKRRRARLLPPTSAQILRYALTQTAGASRTKSQRWSRLDSILKDRFSQEYPNGLSLVMQNSLDGKAEFMIQKLEESQSLEELRNAMTHICTTNNVVGMATICVALEKALDLCEDTSEYESILATMNSLLVWLKKLGATELRDFYVLGMRYACLCLSPQALKRYLREYRCADYGDFTVSEARLLVRTLDKALQLSRWETPGRDVSPMIQVVTASGRLDGTENDNFPSLHSCLPWKEPSAGAYDFINSYVTLLGHLGDVHTLANVWTEIRGRLGTEPEISASLSLSLAAFIEAGDPQKAIQVVHDISSDCDLSLFITPSLWRKLLEHDYNGSIKGLIREQDLDWVFYLELRNIEDKLGVKWTGGEDGWHIDAGNSAAIPIAEGDENSITMNDENPGLESTTRLLTEIKARGSSKSMADISVIVDLLHGHEGREIPLGSIDHSQGEGMEFAWFPQCSPVEFSGSLTPAGNDMSTPSSLGLVRARPDCDGVPRKSGGSLYLMQLGYLSVREKHEHLDLHNGDNPWRDTGHIVAWDRINETFFLFFTGTGRGIIPSELLQSSSFPPSFPYSSARLTIDDELFGYESKLTDSLKEKQCRLHWIDIDPGLGMKP